MSSVRRRGPARKVLLLLLGAVAAIVGIGALWIQSVAAKRRAAMEQLVRQLHAEALARDGSRPPLHGESLPGNAWADYSLALAEIEKLRGQRNNDQRGAIRNFYMKSPNADALQVRTLVREHEITFKHLREGARRAFGNYPCAWDLGMGASRALKGPDRADIELLGMLAASRARILALDGHPREAVLGVLDLFQLARDLCSNSDGRCTSASSDLWSIAEIELKELVFSDEYPRQALSSLEEELERLDRHLPLEAPILVNATLCLGLELLKPEWERTPHLRVGLREYWRYAYSRRIADGVAFEQMVSGVRSAAAALDGSAMEFRAVQVPLDFELLRPKHPGIIRAWGQLFHPFPQIRYARTILRLLRVAVHYRSTGEILEVEDPFGDKLHHSISGSDLKVWSVGKDGVNDGGDNAGRDWSRNRPTPIPGRASREPRDIVLEVER